MALFGKKELTAEDCKRIGRENFSNILAQSSQDADRVHKKYEMMDASVSVRIGKLVRMLGGGRHALYESNIGIIRKPVLA